MIATAFLTYCVQSVEECHLVMFHSRTIPDAKKYVAKTFSMLESQCLSSVPWIYTQAIEQHPEGSQISIVEYSVRRRFTPTILYSKHPYDPGPDEQS